MNMRIDWFQVGKDHWGGNQERLVNICESAEWQSLPCDIAMMPGEAIKSAIKELNIPKVSHVATLHDLAPFSLCGIRSKYKNADVDIFIVDEGTHISPLCAFVTEKPLCTLLTVETVETRINV